MSLTESLIIFRKRAGMTQAQIAKKLGITTAYYGRLEKKGEELSIKQINKIAEVLNVEFNDLLNLGPSQEEISLKFKYDFVKLKNQCLSQNNEIREYESSFNDIKYLFFSPWMETNKEEIFNSLSIGGAMVEIGYIKVLPDALVSLGNVEDHPFNIEEFTSLFIKKMDKKNYLWEISEKRIVYFFTKFFKNHTFILEKGENNQVDFKYYRL